MPDPATPGKNTSVTYTFSAEAGATTECRLDGPAGVGPWVSCTSPRTVSLTQGDGFYVFRVTKVTPAKQQSLAQVKTTIKNLLQSQQQQKALNDFVKDWQKRSKDRPRRPKSAAASASATILR